MEIKLRFTAKSLIDKIRGLQGSKPLGENEGALFVYNTEEILEYWNVGVDYPIDIAFFDKDKNLINVETMAAHQGQKVKSKKPAKYVLEVQEGFFRNKNIKSLKEVLPNE